MFHSLFLLLPFFPFSFPLLLPPFPLHFYSLTYNFLYAFIIAVAEVGFQLVLYTVVEGESVNVTFCVAILSGQLTDVVSLDYSISPMPETASGKFVFELRNLI